MAMVERVEIGDATLYCGDARDLLPVIDAVDVICTDPPYGIKYQSGYATSDLWLSDVIAGDANVLVRDEMIAALSGVPMLVFGSRRQELPAGCRMVLTWDKGPALGMGALDLPWKPSSEEIYVIGRGFTGKRDEGNVLYCSPVQSMAKNGRLHPTQKPVALIERLLRKCPDGVVFDPFMGSGTTGVACANLGRKFIGIEIDRQYFDIACERIGEAYRQPRLFDEPKPKPEQLTMID